MKVRIIFILIIVIIACNRTIHQNASTQITNNKATFFQYNTWGAFVNKVFDGSMLVKELKQKGDIGLGSFDFLDGEMVMNDGVAYRITEDGVVSVGKDEDEIVYADAVFFKPNDKFLLSDTTNYDGLRKLLNKKLPSKNNFYAFKVTGVFDSIVLGGLHKQTPPFIKGLDILIPARPVFKGSNVSGTMIGFYCPQFIGDINAAGYHFHFISDDKKLGGHVMEIKTSKVLSAAMQKLVNYEFRLPEGLGFDTVQFDKQFQYNKK